MQSIGSLDKRRNLSGYQYYKAIYCPDPENYNELTFYISVKVYKGFYDLSEVTFSQLYYNGNLQTPILLNLPEGLRIVKVEGGGIAAGTYAATYTFESDDENMNLPAPYVVSFSIIAVKDKSFKAFWAGAGKWAILAPSIFIVLITAFLLFYFLYYKKQKDSGAFEAKRLQRESEKRQHQLNMLHEKVKNHVAVAIESFQAAQEHLQKHKIDPTGPHMSNARLHLLTHTQPAMKNAAKAVDEYNVHKKKLMEPPAAKTLKDGKKKKGK